MGKKPEADIPVRINEGPAIAALKRLATAFKRTKDAVTPALRTIATGAKWMTAAITTAGAAYVAMSVRALAASDTLGKMGQRVNESASEIERLQLAANRAGGDFTLMNTALTALSRRAAAQPALFERYGIAIKDANGQILGASKLLDNVADRMKRAGSAAEQLAIAQDVGSEAMRKLVPLLRDGSEGLAQLKEAADATGAVITNFEANAAAVLADRFGILKEQAVATARTFGSVFAPAIEVLGKWYGQSTKSMRDWAEANREWMNTGIIKALHFVADNIMPAIATGALLVAKAWVGWQMIITVVDRAINGFFKWLGNAISATLGALKNLAKVGGSLAKPIVDALGAGEAAMAGFAAGAKNNIDATGVRLKMLTAELGALEKSIGDLGVKGSTFLREFASEMKRTFQALQQDGSPKKIIGDISRVWIQSTKKLKAPSPLAQWQRDLAEFMKIGQEYVAAAGDVFGAIGAYADQQTQNAINNAELRASREIAALERTGASEASIAAGRARIEEQLDERRQQLEKAAFERNKALGIVSAVINTAVGITRALSSFPPPANFIMAGLVAAAGAIQIATIASSTFGGGGSITAPSGGSFSAAGFNSAPPVVDRSENTDRGDSTQSGDRVTNIYFNGPVGNPRRTARAIQDTLNFAPAGA